MKISIITPVFNGKKTIRETLKSVVNQEYGNIEHIVIDGHSTDGTLETISDYNHQIAKVVSEPDQGIYDALNKGIRLSTGDIIGILHAGDLTPTIESYEESRRTSRDKIRIAVMVIFNMWTRMIRKK